MPLDILVVDDHADTTEMLGLALGRWGHGYSIAHSAAEAHRAALALRFDVLLCDYALGDGDCCGVLSDIRQLYPIHGIAFTGHGDETHRERAIAMGYADYLIKPLSLPLLKEILDEVEVGRRQAS